MEWVRRRGGWAGMSAEEKMKATARRAVNHRLERGKMVKMPCEICGNPEVQMHHHKGYEGENAFDIQWLCLTHHRAAH